MREIVLDTETTGLDPDAGHRVVEIGCVEIVNLMPTGQTFHEYINPERDMPEEAYAVHGLSSDFLKDQKTFREIVDKFVNFIGDSRMVIHNASFDMKFLNAELKKCGYPVMPMEQSLDTVRMARERFPRQSASLDSLCKRFGIDNSNRVYHGALLDAELLAAVYLELAGGREPGLDLASSARGGSGGKGNVSAMRRREPRAPRPHAPFESELEAHENFLDSLKNPLWRQGTSAEAG